MKLEEKLKKLEESVAALESEDISLEAAFEEYEAGMELVKQCNAMIDKVEKAVLLLSADGEKVEFE